jgi:phosphopantetheinyl transferase
VKFNVVVTDEREQTLVCLEGLEMVTGADEPASRNTCIPTGIGYTWGRQRGMAVVVADAERAAGDETFLKSLLSPTEAAIFQKQTLPKRRHEWLAGRMALKLFLRELLREKRGLDIPMATFTVLSDGAQPRLAHLEDLPAVAREYLGRLHLSIAHGGGVAFGVAAKHAVGVDVEGWRKLEERMLPKFLHPREIKLVSPDEQIALWTVKEAVVKAHGSGFGIGDLLRIHIPEFTYNELFLVTIPDLHKKYACLTFRDPHWVVTIASEFQAAPAEKPLGN